MPFAQAQLGMLPRSGLHLSDSETWNGGSSDSESELRVLGGMEYDRTRERLPSERRLASARRAQGSAAPLSKYSSGSRMS